MAYGNLWMTFTCVFFLGSLCIICLGIIKALWKRELLIPLKPLNQDSRDSYLALALLTLLSGLVWLVFSSERIELTGVEAGPLKISGRITRIEDELRRTRKLVADFYSMSPRAGVRTSGMEWFLSEVRT